MKKIFGLIALVMGAVMCVNAQVNDTVRTVAGNDLYQGITQSYPIGRWLLRSGYR